MANPLGPKLGSSPAKREREIVLGASVRRYRFGYGAAAATYLAVQAFSTVPSPLYPIYARRDHLSSMTITLVYAAYALGVSVSLMLFGHLSDTRGRRPVLAAALLLNSLSCVVFMAAPSLPGLFVARILCGLAVGVTASTATAYLNELFHAHRPAAQVHRVQLLASSLAIGGLGVGALAAGLIADYAGHPLVTPYLVTLVVLAACLLALILAPETQPRFSPRPPYRPQRAAVPAHARRPYFASLTGVAAVFAIFGLFVGLAGAVLARVLHHSSPALSGVVLFVLFGAGVLCTATTVRLRHRTLTVLAGALMTCGLALLVVSVWLPTPNLTVFIVSGAVIGAGGSALFKASLTVAPPSRHDTALPRLSPGFSSPATSASHYPSSAQASLCSTSAREPPCLPSRSSSPPDLRARYPGWPAITHPTPRDRRGDVLLADLRPASLVVNPPACESTAHQPAAAVVPHTRLGPVHRGAATASAGDLPLPWAAAAVAACRREATKPGDARGPGEGPPLSVAPRGYADQWHLACPGIWGRKASVKL